MIVKEAKRIATDWVIKEVSNTSGFCGAFFHGSINWLADDGVMHPTSDIDVIVIFGGQPPGLSGKFKYQSIILEVNYLPKEEFLSADQILGQYYMAGSFSKLSIILDPNGHLAKLQDMVSRSYAESKWVHKRCEGARARVLQYLEQSDRSHALHDQVNNWLFGHGVMTHILLVAGLKNPTVRKRYLDTKNLLEEYGLSDFYESLMEVAGFAKLNSCQVEQHLFNLTETFDIAKLVNKMPYRFAADISDLGRPIAIDGSHELIQNGFHREAMFWIVATYSRCQYVLHHNASGELQNKCRKGYDELLSCLGITTFEDRELSNEHAKTFLPRVWEIAERIMKLNG